MRLAKLCYRTELFYTNRRLWCLEFILRDRPNQRNQERDPEHHLSVIAAMEIGYLSRTSYSDHVHVFGFSLRLVGIFHESWTWLGLEVPCFGAQSSAIRIASYGYDCYNLFCWPSNWGYLVVFLFSHCGEIFADHVPRHIYHRIQLPVTERRYAIKVHHPPRIK